MTKCPHGNRKYRCMQCREMKMGGSGICEHDRRRGRCVMCKGKQICEHLKRTSSCSICDPSGHLVQSVRSRVGAALKSNKNKRSIDYLGCDVNEFKSHIESTFKPGMAWANHGKTWHIDHKVPLAYNKPTLEEVIKRLHWSNTQALSIEENLKKGNRWIG